MKTIQYFSLLYLVSITLSHATTSSVPNDTTSTINCQYHLATGDQTVTLEIIKAWATKAAIQSFELEHEHIETQLEQLKPCYTEDGWQSFHTALEKSGNIAAIQAQHFTAISQLNGPADIQLIKPNQWRAILPLQVVYQNTTERLTQQLNVTLIIDRQQSGDLGIRQLVAVPVT